MSTYKQFIFDSYSFDTASKTASFCYKVDSDFTFTETYRFDFSFAAYDSAVLDRALLHLFLVAGVSYYKAFLPSEIVLGKHTVDDVTARFLTRTYSKGLGEFWYVNSLDPSTQVTFTATTSALDKVSHDNNNGMLISVGGGKDSLTSISMLRNHLSDIGTWSLNHRSQLQPLVTRIGLPHHWVERAIDPQLLSLKDQSGVYNGHIPISAIFAASGVVVAVLTGKRDVVMSNERSADEPTLQYQGVAINHQYSKSSEFEADFQALLQASYGDSIRYYSALRPLGEVQIAKYFAVHDFMYYKDVFSSCNRAFVHGQSKIFWDGTCSKCAFTFLMLVPFIDVKTLTNLFAGKNLLEDTALTPTFRQLLGINADKPLECVGEIAESRWAMDTAKQKFKDLSNYDYDNDGTESVWRLSPHSMPNEVYELLAPDFEKLKG